MMRALASRLTLATFAALMTASVTAAPSVYPVGTTIYAPGETWNGYTVLSLLREPGMVVIDMNGRVVKQWEGFNSSAGGPVRILPNGEVIGAAGARPGHQESLQPGAEGFHGRAALGAAGQRPRSKARAARSRVRCASTTTGSARTIPQAISRRNQSPSSSGAATLVLAHAARTLPAVSDLPLEDDHLVEYDAKRQRSLWEWFAGDHIDELGLSPAARAAIKAGAGAGAGPQQRREFDWLHVNSATYLGPNRWFDAGDKRFDPQNIIISSRQASLLAIVARDGQVVWRMGPDFRESPQLMRIGQIIGQHHAHLIPEGPARRGQPAAVRQWRQQRLRLRHTHRAQWLWRPGARQFAGAGDRPGEDGAGVVVCAGAGFFGTNISGAQRLPNGNTLITEGPTGRVFEVTAQRKIVWEYINPATGPAAMPSIAPIACLMTGFRSFRARWSRPWCLQDRPASVRPELGHANM